MHNKSLSLWRDCILLPLVEYREGVRERERQTDRWTDTQMQKHKDIKKHDITSEREYALGD